MRKPTKPSPAAKPELKLVTVRMPPELHRTIVDLASAQRRSIHGQIMWAIEQHVEREKAAA